MQLDEAVQPTEEPVAAGPVDAPAAEPVAEAPVEADNRQLWYCVDPYGPRKQCAPFRSDAHLNPDGSLTCPNCGNKTVIRAEQYDAAGGPLPPPVVA